MPIKNPRHISIISLINEKGFMPIDELATILDVTPQTIRKDINQLTEEKVLKRYHGGATLNGEGNNQDFYKGSRCSIQNKNLAETVVSKISDGDSLFLTGGEIIEAIAHCLMQQRKELCVITNNIHVASILSSCKDYTTMIASGVVNATDGTITGITTLDFINQFKVDISIVSAAIVESDGSLLNSDYKEVAIAQAMLENSRSRFLISNPTHSTSHALIRLGHITDFNAFFSTKAPSNILRRTMDDSNIDYYIANLISK